MYMVYCINIELNRSDPLSLISDPVSVHPQYRLNIFAIGECKNHFRPTTMINES